MVFSRTRKPSPPPQLRYARQVTDRLPALKVVSQQGHARGVGRLRRQARAWPSYSGSDLRCISSLGFIPLVSGRFVQILVLSKHHPQSLRL